MEDIKESAKENGFVETIYGRRIHTKDILRAITCNVHLQNVQPLINQGSAADVIKLAMIDAHKFLKQKYPSVKMLLQIHDELLFEMQMIL